MVGEAWLVVRLNADDDDDGDNKLKICGWINLQQIVFQPKLIIMICDFRDSAFYSRPLVFRFKLNS